MRTASFLSRKSQVTCDLPSPVDVEGLLVDHRQVGVMEKVKALGLTAIFILIIRRREPFIREGNRMFQVSFLHIDQELY